MTTMKLNNTVAVALATLIMFALEFPGRSQESGNEPEAQAVSQSGLLPVYGVDFAFDPSWVDATQFPSQAAAYSNFGVNPQFQKVWDTLKPAGFNVVRFPVDTRNAQSVNRLANLCVWAKGNSVKLVPVLLGAERGRAVGAEFSTNAAALIRGVIAALRGGNGQSFAAYSQILAYQIEEEMNHAGRHGAMSSESSQLRLLKTASALRSAEQEALKDSGASLTPLMVNASFDFELIKARAISGVTLSDDAYGKAYTALKQFLAEVNPSPDVDVIGVDWFAGSLSAGGAEKFSLLLRALRTDLPGKQIVFTTGFSTGFHSADEQKKFYALVFANLADFRASEGVDSPFVGVFYHEALNGKDSDSTLVTAKAGDDVAKWDWAVKADELNRMWSGGGASDSMSWWLKRVENKMGLVLQGSPNAGTAPFVAQPAQQSLTQIAETVSQANSAAASPSPASAPDAGTASTASSAATEQSESTSTGFGNALKQKAQAGLMSLLDRLFERLGAMANQQGGVGNSGAGNVGDPNTNGSGAPDATPTSLALAREDVTISPATPRAGEQVTVNITVHNQSPNADASGLVVALVDKDSNALAQVQGVAINHGAALSVPLPWAPAEAKTYNTSAVVADANLNVLASAPLDPLTVTGGANAPNPQSNSNGSGSQGYTRLALPLGSPQVQNLIVGSRGQSLMVGQASSVVLLMANPYTRPLTNLKATLLVDGKAVQTQMLASMLPGQSRSVFFTNVDFGQAGKHDVNVMLETREARLRKGSVSSQVEVSSSATSSAIRSDQPLITSLSGTKSSSPVRSMLPSTINVGKLVVPMPSQRGGAANDGPGNSRPNVRIITGRTTITTTPNITTPAHPITSTGDTRAITLNKPGSSGFRLGPEAKPDLSVNANEIGFSPSLPRIGQQLTFAVRVHNIGNADARAAHVTLTLYADGRVAAPPRELITNINANDVYVTQWTVTTPSSRQLRLEVSATAAEDADPRNNRATVDISVAGGTTPPRPPIRPPIKLPQVLPRKPLSSGALRSLQFTRQVRAINNNSDSSPRDRTLVLSHLLSTQAVRICYGWPPGLTISPRMDKFS